ncbi:ABC transporter permease [Xanthobacter versatilis]|uniref:ABC transporter permease n=1 Tax=Xanthobacter autotrophicus (strain ATCC BAA-1158 / Py2) TaxID=78245 RepID=UPI00372838D2
MLLGLLSPILGFPIFLIVSTAFNVGDPQALPATEFGLANVLSLTDHLDWIANTLILAGGGTVIAIAIAVVTSWILFRTTMPGRRVFEMLVALPYPLGPLLGALAWSELASPRSGLINQAWWALVGSGEPLVNASSLGGIMFVMAIFEAPVAVFIIGAAMQRMDPSLEECSSTFGASAAGTAFRITLPLMLPAILGAALFLFTSMMGAFAIPAILGAESRLYVVTTAIYILFQGFPPNYPLASALGLVLIVFTAAAVWAHGRVLRNRSFVVVSGKSYRPRLINVGGWTPLLLVFMTLYVAVSLLLPLGVLLFAAVQKSNDFSLAASAFTLANFRYVLWDYPTARLAIGNSLLLGLGTGLIGTLLTAVLAWVVHRSKGRGKVLLEQVIMLPQAVPHLIFAFGFMWAVLVLPFKLYGTLWAVLLAYVVIFLPLGFRTMSGVVVQIDRALEEAGRVFGANRLRILASITLPLLVSGLTATFALLFMVSVREVSASIFLSSASNPVLGPAILSFWDSGGLPQVSALVIVQTVILLSALIVVRKATGGGPGA